MHKKKKMNIIIFGATSGIGKALFRTFLDPENHLGITGRRTNLLEKLRQEHPQNTEIYTTDINDHEAVDNAINHFVKIFKTIDIAIICAGVGHINNELDYEKEYETISTNMVGWTYVVDKIYHLLENQKHGQLVGISSIGGLRGEAAAPAYSATKAYQINYLEALRKKAFKAKKGITVTDIRPGLVNTAMAQGEGLFWVMPVDKVARQIAKAINAKASKRYVTHRWHALAILIKNLPWHIYKKI